MSESAITPSAPKTPKHEGGRPNVLSSEQVDRVAMLLSAGFEQKEIAGMFGVTRQTIWKYMKSPDAQEQLQAWRDQIKLTVVRRAAEGTVAKAYDMADRATKDDNHKGFDATTRGIAALEKASASASGEAKRLEVDANVQAQAQVDTRALVAAILEHVQPAQVPRV